MKMVSKLVQSVHMKVLWVFVLFPVLSNGFVSPNFMFKGLKLGQTYPKLFAQGNSIHLDARDEVTGGWPFSKFLKKKGIHSVNIGSRALTNLPAFFNEVIANFKPVLENHDSFLSDDYSQLSLEQPINIGQTTEKALQHQSPVGPLETSQLGDILGHYGPQTHGDGPEQASPPEHSMFQHDQEVPIEATSDGLDYPFAGDFNSCWHRIHFGKRTSIK